MLLMKLFVDDIRQAPEGWEIARTNSEAIHLLAGGWVDVISLDHDIAVMVRRPGQGLYVEGLTAETFKAIAYYIALMKKKPIVQFHTGNYAAGEVMAEIIGCEYRRTEGF